MVSNGIDPQSMTNAQIQYCKNCGQRVSETDKFCPKCKKNLSKVGRHITLTLTDSIRVSDYLKLSKKERENIPPENVQWDAETLTFLGVVITVFLGIFSLLVSMLMVPFFIALTSSLLITLLLLIIITKVKIIRSFVVKIIVWLLNKNK